MAAKKQKKKKLSFPLRLLIVVIVLVTIFLCSAILSDSGDSTISDADSVYNGETVTSNVDTSVNSDEAATSSADNSVLVDDDKMKVSFIGAEDMSSLGVFYVTLKIENKTDIDIAVNLEDADVDGETIPMITTGVPLVIRPGNSGQTGFVFSMVNLSISTMDEAEKATFRVVARDNDSYSVVYESELVTVDLH